MTEQHDETKPAQEEPEDFIQVLIAKDEAGRFTWKVPMFGMDSGPRTYGTREGAFEDASLAIGNAINRIQAGATALTSQKLLDVFNVVARQDAMTLQKILLSTHPWPAGEGRSVPMNALGVLNATLHANGHEKLIAVVEEGLLRGFVLETTLSQEQLDNLEAPPPASRIEIVRADAPLPKPAGNGSLSFLRPKGL
jgi:hypothetical protein